ncbi:aspartate ammonia-lyase [Nonomuraea muscovyensis]|uniref:Aspartate ammonia-lyase n=1 Tax=Nonomuraea muscovyensis TaxID=1124761 RepID=A0A7X0EW78_9ACTN|nr:lyase family protein [Nonomuraea muscovyensis]MBB6344014.1 aspartate ammonia-lyase [Nonomuraea muscovyensis]
MTAGHHREHDLLGYRDVPTSAYWGVHTLRAAENFPITGTAISAYPHLINALAAVKEAAARANEGLGLLATDKASAIAIACQEIRGSTRSSPKSSTRSPSRSSVTTSPSPRPPRQDSCSSTPSNRSSCTPSRRASLHLRAACLTPAGRCVSGITANTETLRATVENSIGLVTALNPHNGYTAATAIAIAIAKEALSTGRGVAELVLEKGLLPADRLAALSRPEEVVGAGARSGPE